MSEVCPGCAQCERESFAERTGKAAAARVLADLDLERVCPRTEAVNRGNQPQSPDYRSVHSAVEVKELTSNAHRKFANALHQQDFYRSPRLTSTWNVWPHHDWSSSPSSDRVIPPRQLVKRLIPLLEQLEAANQTHPRVREPTDASFAIVSLLGGGHCEAMPAHLAARWGPGVLLGHLISGERSGYLDEAIVAPIQHWIDNDRLATNMSRSLRDESPRTRCGVLVLGDRLMQPAPSHLRRSLSDFPGEIPTRELHMPESVDVFVVAAGDEILWYADGSGWSRMPGQPVTVAEGDS